MRGREQTVCWIYAVNQPGTPESLWSFVCLMPEAAIKTPLKSQVVGDVLEKLGELLEMTPPHHWGCIWTQLGWMWTGLHGNSFHWLLREELAVGLRINFKYSSWTFSVPHWHRSSLGQCKGMGEDTNMFSGRSSLPFTQWVFWELSALAYTLLSNRDSRAPTPYICSGVNKFLSKINTLSISFYLPILCLLFWS